MAKLLNALSCILLVAMNLVGPQAVAQSYFRGGELVEKPTLITAAGGTTTLTAASHKINIITGSTTQTIVLPDATTLETGRAFFISNEATGNLTVNYNGGTLLGTLKLAQAFEIKLIGNGTSAGQWDVQTFGAGGISSVGLSAPSIFTVSGSPVTSSGTLALTYSGTPLPVANGGTNATTQQAAINSLTGTQAAGSYLRSDGTNSTLSSIQAADVPVLNQNTTGTASNVTGTVAIANGGTGATTAANALNALLPSQTSNVNKVLQTNGTSASWQTIASGSGSGAYELLQYRDFETGALTGYTASGGTFALVSSAPTLVAGSYSASWQATAVGQTVSSAAFQINSLYGSQCAIQIAYTYGGNAGDYSLEAVDGSANVMSQAYPLPKSALSGAGIPNYGAGNPYTQAIPCSLASGSSASTLKWVLVSNVASPSTIYFDNLHLGALTTQTITPQAQLIGTIVASGCNWTTTSTTMADFPVQSGCTYTTTGQALAPTTNIPGIRFAALNAGDYLLQAEGNLSEVGASHTVAFKFWDGTNSATDASALYSQSSQTVTPSISGQITYSSLQTNTTLRVEAIVDASGVTAAIYGASLAPFKIKVWYFPPSSSSFAVQPSIPQQPTQTRITTSGCVTNGTSSCSGNVYYPPANVNFIRVRMAGGGGGGGGGGTSSSGGAGGAGVASTFGTSLLTAAGGGGAPAAATGGIAGGPGGSGTINSPATGLTVTGTNGGANQFNNSAAFYLAGADGGASSFGISGRGAPANLAASAAPANVGAGGGGGATNATTYDANGAGGGGGGYDDAYIYQVASSYPYSVGTGGTAGAAGTNGYAGGAGGSGIIIIDENYTTQAPVGFNGVLVSKDNASGVNIVNTSATYTAAATLPNTIDHAHCNATSGAVTLTAPTSPVKSQRMKITKDDSSANLCGFNANILGTTRTTYLHLQGDTIEMEWNGSQWIWDTPPIRTEVAYIACTSASTISQIGNWATSVSNYASGGCTITIPSGIFASGPFCYTTPATSSATPMYSVGISVTSSTSVTYYPSVQSGGTTSANTTTGIETMCVGGR